MRALDPYARHGLLLGLLAFLWAPAGCAGAASGGRAHPAWIEAPSPAAVGSLRCYKGDARGLPDRDRALELARRRAVRSIVENLDLRIESEQVSYQSETNGAMQLFIGEATVSRALGHVWGLIERGTLVEEATPGGFDAYAQVCVERSTFDEMRAELAEKEGATLELGRRQIETARSALDAGDVLAASNGLELASRALAGPPSGAEVSALSLSVSAERARLSAGLSFSLERDPPGTVEVGRSVSPRLRARLTFEGRPVQRHALACESQEAACRAEPSDEEGRAWLDLGPLDTRGKRSLRVTVRAPRPEGEPLAEATFELPIAPSPRSVMVCAADTARDVADALKSALSEAGLAVTDEEGCASSAPGAWARIAVRVNQRETRCRSSFGDHRCGATVGALLEDAVAGRRISQVRVRREFVHPERSEATAAALGEALRAFEVRATKDARRHAARLESARR